MCCNKCTKLMEVLEESRGGRREMNKNHLVGKDVENFLAQTPLAFQEENLPTPGL